MYLFGSEQDDESSSELSKWNSDDEYGVIPIEPAGCSIDQGERVRRKPLSVATKRVLVALQYEAWPESSTEEVLNCIRPLGSWDPAKKYLPVLYTDDAEVVTTAVERWKRERETVDNVDDFVRVYVKKLECDEAVKETEAVMTQYRENHYKVLDQLLEMKFRVDAANKRRQAREIAELNGTDFLALGFMGILDTRAKSVIFLR